MINSRLSSIDGRHSWSLHGLDPSSTGLGSGHPQVTIVSLLKTNPDLVLRSETDEAPNNSSESRSQLNDESRNRIHYRRTLENSDAAAKFSFRYRYSYIIPAGKCRKSNRCMYTIERLREQQERSHKGMGILKGVLKEEY